MQNINCPRPYLPRPHSGNWRRRTRGDKVAQWVVRAQWMDRADNDRFQTCRYWYTSRQQVA